MQKKRFDLLIVVAAVLIAVLVLFAQRALSHDAPSGWRYPPNCCAEQHCRPVACEALTETRDGIRFLGLTFTGGQIKASGDQSCHVCIGYDQNAAGENTRNPICVFLKPES